MVRTQKGWLATRLVQRSEGGVGSFIEVYEGLEGIEPSTRCLKGTCSTTELQAHVVNH